MMKDNLNEHKYIKNIYDLELEKVLAAVNESKAKSVLLQFPDGLKHRAKEVVDKIENDTQAKCFVWFGNCFGGCDIPITLRHKIELLIQFGHNKFIKNPEGWEK